MAGEWAFCRLDVGAEETPANGFAAGRGLPSCGDTRSPCGALRNAPPSGTMVFDASDDFGPFEGHAWLDCAHQAPLPKVARAEAEEAVAWKAAPWELSTERFSGVPRRLKQALARLIAAS